MSLNAQVLSGVLNACILSTFKIASGVNPRTVVLQVASAVHFGEQAEDLMNPLAKLSALVRQAEDPLCEAISRDDVTKALENALDKMRTPASRLNEEVSNQAALAYRRFYLLVKPLSSQPVDAKRFSDVPPTPLHLSIPPAALPPHIGEPNDAASHLRPEFIDWFINRLIDLAGYWELGQDGTTRLLKTNEKFKLVSGWDDRALSLMELSDLFHPDDWEEFKKVRRDVAQYGFGCSEKFLRVIDAEQNVRWVELRVGVLESGSQGLKGYFMLVDQTASHHAQEENMALRAAYRYSPRATLVFRMPIDGNLDDLWLPMANLSFEQALGYDSGEVQGKTVSEFFPKDSRLKSLTWLIRGIRRRKLSGQEIEMLHKDGRKIKFDIEGDISESGGDLFAVVTFTPSDQRIENDRMRALATFVPNFAHDFNNTLAVPSIECELALRMLRSGHINPEELIKKLMIVKKDLAYMADYILELQGLASPGGRKENRGPIEPADIMDVDQIQATLGYDVLLDFRMNEGLWYMPGPPSQIWKCLENILVNAREAMAQSESKRVRIEVVNVTVSQADLERMMVEDRGPGEFVRITIADNGPGIPESSLRKIFELYHTTKKEPSSIFTKKGSGRGLWNTHQIITDRGGFVRAESEVGEGATFEIYLPRMKGIGQIPGVPSSRKANAGVILTVGDGNERAYRVINLSLQMKSEAYREVASLEDALRLLKENDDIRALILHVPRQIPGLNEAIAEMRHVRDRLPVVLVSSDTVEIGVAEDSVTTVMRKRFLPDDLMAAMHRIMKKSG